MFICNTLPANNLAWRLAAKKRRLTSMPPLDCLFFPRKSRSCRRAKAAALAVSAKADPFGLVPFALGA